MFTHADVAANVKPDLRCLIDFTKVASLGNAAKFPIFNFMKPFSVWLKFYFRNLEYLTVRVLLILKRLILI